MRRALVAVALVGCGRIGFDPAGSADALDENDAPTALAPCGSTLLIDDSFDDGDPRPAFSPSPRMGLALVEAGGTLEVRFAPSVTTGYAHYRSFTFATPGVCATVEVLGVPSGAASAYMKLRSDQLEVEMITGSGMIEMRTYESGTVITRAAIPLDLVENRFWRIYDDAGTTYWQTSPDGAAFETRASLPGFFTTPTCALEIGAGTSPTVTNGGAAVYERAVVVGP